MMRRNNSLIFLMAAMALLSACSLAPQYQRPRMPVAELLPISAESPQASAATRSGPSNAMETGWREFFPDPVLHGLISTALEQNRDLKTAALAVEQYQALYRIQRAELFPVVGGGAGMARQRALGSQGRTLTQTYSASVGITSYELDLFGRIRNLKDAALERYLGMEQTYRSTVISLVAETANAYLGLLADTQLSAISRDTVDNENESFRLIGYRVAEGVTNEMELAQARSSLENARSSQALYDRLIVQDQNALAFLTASAFPKLDLEDKWIEAQRMFSSFPVERSSEVLLQRPDVMAAEHELKASHADIGAARAAFFPSIALTTSAGFMSPTLGDLFESGSGVWLFSPTVTVPIFTGGRLQGQLDAAEIRKESAVVLYEKAIQSAFREVADALAARDGYVRQLAAQKALLAASERYYALARQRYEKGIDSFLTLLDAQRQLFAARQAFIHLEFAQMVNHVTLYKALGGGWKE